MSNATIARADAAFQEQMRVQWRDWCSYLRSRIALLDAQTDDRYAAFEQADAQENVAAASERQLALLAVAQRALFDRICEERRQQAQLHHEGTSSATRAADPDAVERTVLHALLAEALGTTESEGRFVGWGDVPVEIEGAVHWYRVNVASLQDAPQAAAYAVSQRGGDDLRRRIALAGLLVVAGVAFLIGWLFWPRGQSSLVALQGWQPQSNGAPATVWPIQTLRFGPDANASAPIVIEPITGGWPKTQISGGFWRQDSFAPVQLCIPASQLQEAESLTLGGSGTTPVRQYALSERATDADLSLEACDRAESPRRYGTLQTALSPAAQQLGQAVLLADEQPVTVTSITLEGPAEGSDRSSTAAYVEVRLVAPPLDWPVFAPTLLLASGESFQTPEVTPTGNGATLRYAIPLPSEALELSWQLTSPGAPTLTWRATLPIPLTRAERVATSVSVDTVALRLLEGSIVLDVTVTSRAQQPFQLAPEDIALAQDATPLLVTMVSEIDTPLAVGETRTLGIPLSDEFLSAPIVLAVGLSRFEIQPPKGAYLTNVSPT